MTSSAVTRTVLWLHNALRGFGQNVAFRFLNMLLLEVSDEQWCCWKHFGNTLVTGELQLVGLVIDERKIVMFLESKTKALLETSQD